MQTPPFKKGPTWTATVQRKAGMLMINWQHHCARRIGNNAVAIRAIARCEALATEEFYLVPFSPPIAILEAFSGFPANLPVASKGFWARLVGVALLERATPALL